ncbi:MAG TPA: glycerophosphodiester phosphodiesterase [Candidatus Binataceae bacterium]|nr:glycerophosphodiester phosphodiesterase [Candidatus Binataceae bacterium]
MKDRFETEFFDLPPLRLIAHRGASGDYPENSLPSFEAAARAGMPYIELDVQMTSDGEIVVIHDEDLKRVAGQAGIVAAMTLLELQGYDIGSQFTRDGATFPFREKDIKVPMLLEVLETFPQIRFVIEIKQGPLSLVPKLLKVLADTRMTKRVIVASEHQQPLDEIRALAPRIPTNFSSREVADFLRALVARDLSITPLGAALQIPPEYGAIKLATPESVAAAHRLGLEVHVWTVNEPSQMRELMAMGVDGLIGDYPTRLREVAASI